jgi:hypothetical protein
VRLVLGPFGLPLLYKSPKFSKKLKILLTIAVMIYTAYLISASIEIARKLYMRMEENQYFFEVNTVLPLIDSDFRSSKNEGF